MPSWIPGQKARKYRAVPAEEQFGELLVYHPRYPLIPKIGLTLHGLLMFLGAYSTVRRLVAQQHFDCIDAHFIYPDAFAAVCSGKHLASLLLDRLVEPTSTFIPRFGTYGRCSNGLSDTPTG